MVRLNQWRRFCRAAEVRGSQGYTPFDTRVAALAVDFKTCAVGELCEQWGPPWSENIGEPGWGKRIPDMLMDLGYDFTNAVFAQDIDWALTIIGQIEAVSRPALDLQHAVRIGGDCDG